VVAVAGPPVACPAPCRQTRCQGDAGCPPPSAPQSPEGRAYAHGAHPGRGGRAVAHHHPRRSDVVRGGCAVWVSCEVASGVGVEKNEATAAAQPDPEYASYECGRHGAGAVGGVGAPRGHHAMAAQPVERHGPARYGGGQQLVPERTRPGYTAATGAGQMVGGPSPGVLGPLASVSV
jgi:hypothetical protein